MNKAERQKRINLVKEHIEQKKREIEDRIELAFKEIENLLNTL